MMLLAVAHVPLWLALLGCEVREPQPIAPWRIVETPDLHVGIRGHTDGTGAAITLQVSWR